MSSNEFSTASAMCSASGTILISFCRQAGMEGGSKLSPYSARQRGGRDRQIDNQSAQQRAAIAVSHSCRSQQQRVKGSVKQGQREAIKQNVDTSSCWFPPSPSPPSSLSMPLTSLTSSCTANSGGGTAAYRSSPHLWVRCVLHMHAGAEEGWCVLSHQGGLTKAPPLDPGALLHAGWSGARARGGDVVAAGRGGERDLFCQIALPRHEEAPT